MTVSSVLVNISPVSLDDSLISRFVATLFSEQFSENVNLCFSLFYTPTPPPPPPRVEYISGLYHITDLTILVESFGITNNQ